MVLLAGECHIQSLLISSSTSSTPGPTTPGLQTIGVATGEALANPLHPCFRRGVLRTESADREPRRSSPPVQPVKQSWSSPTTSNRSSPVPDKKQPSSVGAVCGNDCSYTNITDFSVTDGIDEEHEQEQH